MKGRCITYAVLVFASLLVASTGFAQETYTVRPGDTLYGIATTHGLTVDELKELNGLTTNNLQVGEELLLASPPEPVVEEDAAPEVERVTTYTVRAGQTLYSIAAELGTQAYVLEALNEDVEGALEAGRQLSVPANPEGRSIYARGEAAVFPETYAGRIMAGGEPYDPAEFVISHRDLAMGTVLLLENRDAGRATFARVADRGPLRDDLLFDVSGAVADALRLDEDTVLYAWLVE